MTKGKKSALLDQGRTETKPKARAEKEIVMFIENFGFGSSEMFVGVVFIFGITIGAVVFLAASIATGRWRKEKDWHKQFKKYFSISIDWRYFSKDTGFKPWRDKHSKEQIIIRNRIDTVLPPLSNTFFDFCKKRDELMEPYYSAQSGEEGEASSSLKNKRDLKKLTELESNISLAEKKFRETCEAAQEAGFTVKTSAKEYRETKKKEKVKSQEEAEVES